MTRLTRLTAFGLLLVAAGCRTCDDRPRPFARLRDAFDRDDDRARIAPVRHDAGPRLGDPCAPCAGGIPTHAGTVLGGGYGGPVIGAPLGIGGSVYPSGPGTVLPPPGSFAPRDNELPPPGGYSQPGAVDMGRVAPRPPAGGLAGK